MERWSIEVEKEYLKFSAAHFLIFPDGSAERLHGHNYRVFVEIDAALTDCGLVIDFSQVKPIIREMVDELDEHWLVPGEHVELRSIETKSGLIEVRYRERYYAQLQVRTFLCSRSTTPARRTWRLTWGET